MSAYNDVFGLELYRRVRVQVKLVDTDNVRKLPARIVDAASNKVLHDGHLQYIRRIAREKYNLKVD